MWFRIFTVRKGGSYLRRNIIARDDMQVYLFPTFVMLMCIIYLLDIIPWYLKFCLQSRYFYTRVFLKIEQKQLFKDWTFISRIYYLILFRDLSLPIVRVYSPFKRDYQLFQFLNPYIYVILSKLYYYFGTFILLQD